tara:strand:- start:225 stop:536 length:312 start_codon:yes stop_codon:yes gene_type:complete
MKNGLIVSLLYMASITAFAESNLPYQIDSKLYYGDIRQPDKEFQSLDVCWKDNENTLIHTKIIAEVFAKSLSNEKAKQRLGAELDKIADISTIALAAFLRAAT